MSSSKTKKAPVTDLVRPPDSTVPERPLTLLMVAGETSGDSHGAELILALRQQQPNVRIIGVGGPRMAAAGQRQLFDLSAHAVLGLAEVLKHYFKFRGFFNQVLQLARTERPDAVILIDNPGFNLRLATALRRELPGSRTIYYISPQVWAWKAGRVKAMQRDIDLLLAILPFEKNWYAQRAPKFNVQWVGHPLLDRIHQVEVAEPNAGWIALLPGSRRTEVRAHLPVLWEVARLMANQHKGLKFVLLSPNDEIQKYSLSLLEKFPAPNFDFEYNISYAISHLSRCALALVASGTASLECALVGVPQVVVYRVHPLTFAVGRQLVKVKHLSMVNVLAGEDVVPELLQERFQPELVAREALDLLVNQSRRDKMKHRVAEIVATLGGPGASQRAAKAILFEAAFAKVG
ncbi:MAG: lipid-A-disaccharide synthase [Methylacidiphilales bacterium]|nr:lipid-A-disaccharide synthase [Candidatus Methylacidiphilales bacterium]